MKIMTTNKASSCQLSMLTMAVVSLMTCTATHASVERHGDLEIYKKPQAAAPVITLMLDVSGSMRAIDEPSRGCSYDGDKPYEENKYGYTTYFCKSGGRNYYRRIDNLKMGVSDLVNSPELKGKVNLGIGTYPLSSANNSKAEVSGNGHIDVPANILDDAHASDIKTFIKNIQPTWNTPIAQAYGEVGAYMMGTKTNDKVTTPYYLNRETYQIDTGFLGWGFGVFRESDKKCIAWNNINKSQISINSNLITCKTWQNVSRLNERSLENEGNLFNRTDTEMRGLIFKVLRYDIDVYTKVVAENDAIISNNNIVPYPLIDTTLVENKYSGFKYSVDGTKNDTKINYKSPLPESKKSCAGNGIYFLTDGYPNQSSTTIAKSVMNNSLEPLAGTQKLTVECSGTDQKAWPCILDYSQKLLDTNNPKGIEIKTATVGFGSAFNSIRSATTEAECEAGDNEDVKNLCKWGIRGKGGFYYADDSQGIVNSIKSLTGKLTEDIPPVSTGSMAVPLDDLNVSTSRKFAYLPLLDPQPLAPYKLWKGNLKKYNVKNGTLVDQSNKAVFTNKDGVFASNTADIYNTLDATRADAKRPDKALPQVGGTYQHIFENNNSRNLFVNQAGSLIGIGVDGLTAAAKPVGFNSLDASYQSTHRQQLLNFLGFPLATPYAITPIKAIGVAFDPTKKQLGGVLHSLPQLISKKAELKADGTIDNTKREDYVLYGSFDGALHVVRDDDSDKAGEEVLTFIPKHVLDQQGTSFVNPDRVADNPVFGVDGPWSVFTNYKYSSAKVEAQQSLAFGGLRMGGSMYYGLNLSDLDNPEMIYSVGSTYAIDGSSNANGVKNDTVANTTTNTNDQKAYAKMGLSFAKPSVGYVMKDGKRVMVNFLAGGYDRCYEDPNFKLGSNVTTNTVPGCNGSKSSAQGNGIYMVQVGQEKVDKKTDSSPEATNESSFDTTVGNGNLLWWTSSSNNGAGNANFTKVEDMTHSVVTEIRTLDRNYDGLTDQLVFADLGGRVWRVDINNSVDTENFKIERVAKMLDLSILSTNTELINTNASSDNDALPRIYEKPLVTFTRLGEGTDIVGLVTVGTGDRSSPVTAQRDIADRIYTFVDRDIARPNLFCYDIKSTAANECANVTMELKQKTAITPENLVPLTTNSAGEFSNDNSIKTNIDNYSKLGWYKPLTSWASTNTGGGQVISGGNKGIKMFNQPDAVAGLLFTTAYNPKVGDTSGTCSAGVTGLTQREQMCLPYGVCMNKDADGNWVVRKTRYLSNAGIGIVDNIISDGNFSGDTKNSVVVLENFCEGADCSSGKTNLVVNPITEELNCQGMSCKIVTESQLDPMQWKER